MKFSQFYPGSLMNLLSLLLSGITSPDLPNSVYFHKLPCKAAPCYTCLSILNIDELQETQEKSDVTTCLVEERKDNEQKDIEIETGKTVVREFIVKNLR